MPVVIFQYLARKSSSSYSQKEDFQPNTRIELVYFRARTANFLCQFLVLAKQEPTFWLTAFICISIFSSF